MAGQGPSPIRRGACNTHTSPHLSNTDLARRLCQTNLANNETPTTLLEDLIFTELDSASDSDLDPAGGCPRRNVRSRFPRMLGSSQTESRHQSPNNEGKMGNRNHQRASSTQSQDYLAGNCMTCGSLMKWPKTVGEFRCTICETINDLVPLRTRDHTAPQTDTARPLSLGHTRKLVQDCLRDYLIKRLCKKPEEKGERNQIPQAQVSHQRPLRECGTSSNLPYTKAEGEAKGSSEYKPGYVFSEEHSLRRKPLTPSLTSEAVSTSPTNSPSIQKTVAPRVGAASREDDRSSIFRPVHDYLVACFRSFENVSAAFPKTHAEGSLPPRPHQNSPQINWNDLSEWYSLIINPAEIRHLVYAEISQRPDYANPSERSLWMVDQDVLQAQARLQRTLMKVTENILKRPGGKITEPEELRFFLILLENPLLNPKPQDSDDAKDLHLYGDITGSPKDTTATAPLAGRHSRILKRIIGLVSTLPAELQNQLTAWWSRHQLERFVKTKDLISGFLNYRMLRQEEKTNGNTPDVMGGLVPQLPLGWSGADLRDQIRPRKLQKQKQIQKPNSYPDDWQIRAASRVLSLLFDANNPHSPNRMNEPVEWSARAASWRSSVTDGLFLNMSDFYNSLVDKVDLIGDFTGWEQKFKRFSFCQYPFLLSIWAKMQILEHDVKRQMDDYAREAFINNILHQRNASQQLLLNVRRECLVEDSLKAVGESIGSTTNDAKKALRIRFEGEEGIDSGGLRKEWFLLLVREVFSHDIGLFTYDENSKYCYFNPFSFESTDQFFLIGAVLGLAIYNTAILDVPLPPFVFRKLLSAAPGRAQPGSLSQVCQPMRYGLDDLAQYRPQLAKGLKQLLEYEGDVEATFCLDFVVDVQKYDTTVRVPLCEGGEARPVTNDNRREYVDLYIRYLLDTAVSRQFDPFKRGFYSICSGNAFSLFRPEEVELLIRGSGERLDVATLRGVARYNNWSSRHPDGKDPEVGWFWEVFEEGSSEDQRKLLAFITGSDRLPAFGASSMVIQISCVGDDCARFPVARTCFNTISLYKYGSKKKLRSMLWRAVHESKGFGLH